MEDDLNIVENERRSGHQNSVCTGSKVILYTSIKCRQGHLTWLSSNGPPAPCPDGARSSSFAEYLTLSFLCLTGLSVGSSLRQTSPRHITQTWAAPAPSSWPWLLTPWSWSWSESARLTGLPVLGSHVIRLVAVSLMYGPFDVWCLKQQPSLLDSSDFRRA